MAAGQHGELAWVHDAGQVPSEVHLWQEPGREPWGMFIVNALRARCTYESGRDYLVKGATVRIIDESTGRMTKSRWMKHLHQVRAGRVPDAAGHLRCCDTCPPRRAQCPAVHARHVCKLQ